MSKPNWKIENCLRKNLSHQISFPSQFLLVFPLHLNPQEPLYHDFCQEWIGGMGSKWKTPKAVLLKERLFSSSKVVLNKNNSKAIVFS